MANKLKRKEMEEKEQKRTSVLTSLLKKNVSFKPPKRKTVGELYSMMSLHNFEMYEIRPRQSFVVRSYNLERQKKMLLQHLYVKYPVPEFMYNLFFPHLFLRSANFNPNNFGFDWFFCMAQGGSFQKLTKGVLTKKECISFFKAPDNYSVLNAFWFAKLHNRNIPHRIIKGLIFDKEMFDLPATPDIVENQAHIIEWYAKYGKDMNDTTFNEVTDCIRAKTREDRTFSLNGRTLNSVTLLSNVWHNLMMNAKYGTKVTWDGTNIKPWTYERNEIVWEAFEIKSNHDLIKEGNKQRHCVSSYVDSCMNEKCKIFSLRCYHVDTLIEIEKNRVTLEVRNKNIVQARGLMNRLPSTEENIMIRKFAEHAEYSYSNDKYW